MASCGVLGTALAGINTARAGHVHPESLAPAQQSGDRLDIHSRTWQLGALSPRLSEVTYHLLTWYTPSGLNDTKSSEKSIQSDSRQPRAIETFFYNESGL